MRAFVCVVAMGCGGTTEPTDSATPPTEVTAEQIQQEWGDYVASHGACDVAEDCVALSPGCPLGCFSIVNAESAEEAAALAASLIDAYQESCGCGCDYGCAPTGVPDCVDGTCQATPY